MSAEEEEEVFPCSLRHVLRFSLYVSPFSTTSLSTAETPVQSTVYLCEAARTRLSKLRAQGVLNTSKSYLNP